MLTSGISPDISRSSPTVGRQRLVVGGSTRRRCSQFRARNSCVISLNLRVSWHQLNPIHLQIIYKSFTYISHPIFQKTVIFLGIFAGWRSEKNGMSLIPQIQDTETAWEYSTDSMSFLIFRAEGGGRWEPTNRNLLHGHWFSLVYHQLIMGISWSMDCGKMLQEKKNMIFMGKIPWKPRVSAFPQQTNPLKHGI